MRTGELEDGSRKRMRRMQVGRKMLEGTELTRSLEEWESEKGGSNEGSFEPSWVTRGTSIRLHARTHLTGPPMLVVKGARREERRDNRCWMNRSLFDTESGGGPVKRYLKAASKAAENGGVLTRTHSSPGKPGNMSFAKQRCGRSFPSRPQSQISIGPLLLDF